MRPSTATVHQVYKLWLGLSVIVQSLCEISFDMRRLPQASFSRHEYGWQGPYYEVNFELGVIFGPEVIFQFIHNGEVVETVVANYVQ